MSDLVKIHKDFNRSAVPFYEERAIKLFSEITSRWNDSENFEPITFNLVELTRALGMDGSHNKEYFDKFVLDFVKDTTVNFFIGKNQITGNVFSILRNEEKNIFEVHMNSMIKHYMFNKKDIELMTKAKKKEKMSIQELELLEQNKEKYQNLMLYSKAELQGISGKYNKRLYMLLVQFKKTGFFVMDYKQFKGVLEIPETYRQYDIDLRVLGKAKEELKKVGINIYNINKIKVGNVINRIEISFEYKTVLDEVKKVFETTEIDTTEERKMPDEIATTGLENIKKIREDLKKIKRGE